LNPERSDSQSIRGVYTFSAHFKQWGNFVQTYSMVGLINAAIRLSKRWDTAF
jgi:hypothetical protein